MGTKTLLLFDNKILILFIQLLLRFLSLFVRIDKIILRDKKCIHQNQLQHTVVDCRKSEIEKQ